MAARPKSEKRTSQRRTKTDENQVEATLRHINIFISHASEDNDLAGGVKNLLRETFEYAPVTIFLDREIRQGQNWHDALHSALDKTDILLVIVTDRLKMSFSYTGYEVGYFNSAIKQRPTGGAGFDRIFIPFCIGADIPDTMHYIEGVTISPDDVYKVLKTKFDSGMEPAVDETHPIYKLLARLSAPVLQITQSTDKNFETGARTSKLKNSASALYRIVHEYLQGRISSETFPERKLVIKTTTRPTINNDGADLATANIELVGDFADIFNIPATSSIGREYTWSEFCEKLPDELRSNSIVGIRQLAATVLKGSGDNYHVVTTVQRDKSYRLFVSKVITYVSQKTEMDIYVLQMRTKEYGDPETTRLLKAISVGLKFRFLFLEEESKFRPQRLGYPVIKAAELKPLIAEMLGQVDLALREGVEANLSDPDLLISIYGPGQEKKVQEMMILWDESRQRLSATAENVQNSDDSSFVRRKEEFIDALKSFCANIENMNREYTSRVLRLLDDYVQQRLGQRKRLSGNIG